MNILIIGGFGMIGTAITEKLCADHNVFIIDSAGILPDEQLEDSVTYVGASIMDAQFALLKREINLVIDLAEDASLAYLMQAEPIVNMGDTASLIYQCATSCKPITYLLCTWSEPPPKQSSPFACASHTRRLLPALYNKGNMVVTELALPRIINASQSISNFGNIVGRILYSYTYNRFPFVEDSEYPSMTTLSWSNLKPVVDFITSFVGRRTRDPQKFCGCRATFGEVVGYTLDELDLGPTRLHIGKSGPMTFERLEEPRNDDGIRISEWVSRTVNQFLDDHREEGCD
jgi:hypothetical protein